MVTLQMNGVPTVLDRLLKLGLELVGSVTKDFGYDIWTFPCGPKLTISDFLSIMEYFSYDPIHFFKNSVSDIFFEVFGHLLLLCYKSYQSEFPSFFNRIKILIHELPIGIVFDPLVA